MALFTDVYVLPEGSKERTFQYDRDLPGLPLPSLSDTLTKYLDSVKPLVSDDEFRKTAKIVKNFESGVGSQLQEKLKERATKEKNWLEQWWEDYAYLINREPLMPGCNMIGPSPVTELGWKYAPGKQMLFAARYCYQTVSLWKIIRQERYRPLKLKTKSGGLKVFNMNQYRRLFNTCQIPRNFKDEMVSYFKTEAEGDCPSHVVIIYKGRLYKLETLHPDGSLITTAEWYKMLTWISDYALEIEEWGEEIASLTCDNRDSWAENREYLVNLDKRNAEHLQAIESCMFVLSLDGDCPETPSQVSHFSLAGDLACRWADKALSIIFFENGSCSGLCNHAAYDGIVSVTTMHFLLLALAENRDNWQESFSVRPDLIIPEEMEFVVDDDLRHRISQTRSRQDIKRSQYLMIREEFSNFGKTEIQKTHQLHPDAFVQMALQLAYFKMHKRPAATYETANTRSFYNGRTETHRSCTNESLEWCHAMVDQTRQDFERAKLLRIAVEKHVKLLKEAEQNAGCDRHLFGLQCLAWESGMDTPDIFTDPSYVKSGGNGNFILSTSLVGYTELGGGVMPMCLDGYGCFYNLTSSKIAITISVRKDSNETSAYKFFQGFADALIEMNNLPSNQVQNKEIDVSKL